MSRQQSKRRRRPAPPKWERCSRTGKRGFVSEGDALIGAANLPATYVRAYRCEFCDRWHVTSQRKRKVRSVKGYGHERKEDMAKAKDEAKAKVLDPTRSEERAALERAEAEGFDPKVVKGYEVVRFTGERVYFSDDKADAEDRLKGLAALTGGIGGDGNGEPAYTIREVSYIEVDAFDPSGPESRTRGKHDGSPADDDE